MTGSCVAGARYIGRPITRIQTSGRKSFGAILKRLDYLEAWNEKQKIDSGCFDCGNVYPGAAVQLRILPAGYYPGIAGMGFAWVVAGADLGVVRW